MARPALGANAGAATAAMLFGASVVAVRVAVRLPPGQHGDNDRIARGIASPIQARCFHAELLCQVVADYTRVRAVLAAGRTGRGERQGRNILE
jgi:hypothetical protein